MQNIVSLALYSSNVFLASCISSYSWFLFLTFSPQIEDEDDLDSRDQFDDDDDDEEEEEECDE